MKRVAIFRSDLLFISETFIRDQARALREWEPVLVGFREVAGGLQLDGLRHRIVPRGSRVSFGLRTMLARPLPRLVAALGDLNVRLVHAHFGTDAADIWPSVRAAGLPMLVTLHGFDINTHRAWWEAGHGGLARRTYPRRLLRMAGDPSVRFVAVSNAIQQRAVDYGIPGDKLAVSYIGVDTERFKPGGVPLEQRRRRILFVGRMVEKKAPLLMIRAFEGLRRQVADAELVMIGDGPLLADARQLAEELRSPVLFLGARGADEVLAQLQLARVLCLPSVTATNGDAEGFGLTVLEAQACGVPVVTSALGGATEGLLPGRTGHAVPEGDVAQLSACLLTWLMDEEAARNASVAAWQFARDAFNMEHCTRKLELAYNSFSGAAGWA